MHVEICACLRLLARLHYIMGDYAEVGLCTFWGWSVGPWVVFSPHWPSRMGGSRQAELEPCHPRDIAYLQASPGGAAWRCPLRNGAGPEQREAWDPSEHSPLEVLACVGHGRGRVGKETWTPLLLRKQATASRKQQTMAQRHRPSVL